MAREWPQRSEGGGRAGHPSAAALASMSRAGICYDNALIESFWSSLEYELVYHQRFATFAEARTA